MLTVIIPARLNSSRLPKKPLADICGYPMIVRTAQKAIQFCNNVCIATDSEEVAAVCKNAGFKAILTSEKHPTGTDRISEAGELLNLRDDDIIINLQGDEPLMPVAALKKVAELLEGNPKADISTLGHPIRSKAEFISPNVVKIVVNSEHAAMYFSRAPIPYPRDAFRQDPQLRLPDNLLALHHLGLYAYRMRFVRMFPKLEMPYVEKWESLEQLRALYYGYRIQVGVIDEPLPPGVDTQEDLERVRQYFSHKENQI